MTNRQEIIRDIWDSLMHQQGKPGERVRQRIDENAPLPLYAACTFPHKKSALDIGPVKNVWLPQGFGKPRIKGLNISLDAKVKLPGSDVSIVMELESPDDSDIFLVFATRVCEEVESLQEPEMAVKRILALIEKWRNFFSGSGGLLSDTRQTGLYGELYIFILLCDAGIPPGAAIKAWTGSRRTSQDYEFGPVSIEAKSSTAVDTSTVNITNITQLDDTGIEFLYLARLTFDARQGGSHTLPAMVENIRSILGDRAPHMRGDFDEKLVASRYRDSHAEHYLDRSYTEREAVFYRVGDGFPRLLESGLPEGVIKVSYEISLEHCGEFREENDAVYDTVRQCCD